MSSSGLVMPPGDPAALRQASAQLRSAGQDSTDLGDQTTGLTTAIISDAQWTEGEGTAAFEQWGNNLGKGAAAFQKLNTVADAGENVASALENAQNLVQAANTIAEAADNDPSGSLLASAMQATQNAQDALDALQLANEQAEQQINSVADGLSAADLFGANGPVTTWLRGQPQLTSKGLWNPEDMPSDVINLGGHEVPGPDLIEIGGHDIPGNDVINLGGGIEFPGPDVINLGPGIDDLPGPDVINLGGEPGGLGSQDDGLGSLLGPLVNYNAASDGKTGAAGRNLTGVPTEGDPVDVATGDVVLGQVDVRLAGTLPLVLGRAHRSSYRAGRWLGTSWMSTLDQRLRVTAGGVAFARADGSVLWYPHPDFAEGQVWPASGARWPLARDGDGYAVSDPQAGVTLRFAPRSGYYLSPDGYGELPLVSVSSRAGHRIVFEYDLDGAPSSVTHDGGYQVRVTVTSGRVTGLALAGAGGDGLDVALVHYRYDRAGNLAEVVNSSGLALRFTYDADGRLSGWQDRNGWWYRYCYDAAGRCVRGEGPDGQLSGTFAYDLERSVTTCTDSAGAVTVYQITGGAWVAAVTDPLGHVTRSEYDQHGLLVSRTDPLGRTTRWSRDRSGNLTALARADGVQGTAVYSDQGLPVLVTEAGGARWEQEFDERGNMVRQAGPDGAVTRFCYDERGGLAQVTDPLGGVTDVRCNRAGLPVAVTAPDGGVTWYERDAFGRVTAVAMPGGRVTRLQWTVEGKLAARVLPGGGTEQFSYDGEGNLVAFRDAAGEVTRFEYGNQNRLAARTAPDGTRTEFGYDHALRLTSVVHAGLAWRYELDLAGRLVAQTDYNGSVTRYARDAAGQLTGRVNAIGQQVSYSYDLLGKVAERDADGVVTRFGYDTAGRLASAANPDALVRLHRDAAGRVVAETCNGRTVRSDYDVAGRRTLRVTPSGSATRWEYDAAGRPAVLHAAGQVIRFGYDQSGKETLRELPGGVTLAQEWDPAGRLAAQVLTAAPAEGLVLQRRDYSYRADGLLAGIDDLLSGPRRLELDRAGQITGVTGPGWAERYGYDPAGNITAAAWPEPTGGPVPAALAAVAGAQGQREHTGTLIARAGHIRYEHDRAGRIILRQHARLSRRPDTWRYEWDAEDKLTAVITPDGTRWQYCYDPLGRRIAKRSLTPGGQVVTLSSFTWDGAVLAEQETFGSDVPTPDEVTTWDYRPGTFTPLTQAQRWLRAPQDQVDQRFYAIVTDLIGTPAELVSPGEGLAGRQRHSLWGATYWSGASTPLRFPGQYADDETGLHYNYQRYYDPATGRYLSSDPLGLAPAPNPHAYVFNPTRLSDPLGLDPGGTVSEDDDPVRTLVDDQEELLAKAQEAAGGNLDDLTEIKPGWWQGETPDGTTVKIEWEPAGHSTTNEGPHVTVRVLKDPAQGVQGGWKVVDKIFIRGQETYRGG